jgi:4-hydroxybenzoate polyprenyltransferase
VPRKLQALLATARIANVPSVASNVLTGMLLWVFTGINCPMLENASWHPVVAACCLYIAGNFLNDWYDADWDRDNRPERAIPSGLYPRWFYLSIAMFLAISGFYLVAMVSKVATLIYLLIAVFVIAYTLLHKRHSFSIWIMGACRMSLYLLGMVAVDWSRGDYDALWYILRASIHIDSLTQAIMPLLGMLCYIAGISLLARHEAQPSLQGNTKLIASLLLLSPAMTHSCYWIMQAVNFEPNGSFFVIAGIIPFMLWTIFGIVRKMSVPKKVGHLLAGIPLVDSVILWCSILSWGIDSTFHLNLTYQLLLLYPLAAFLLALLLQKIAPAT